MLRTRPLKGWLVAVLLALGISVLPQAVQFASATAPAPCTSTTHVIRMGETLTGIAAQYGLSVTTLARTNGISNPNLMYAGQRLAIPCNPAPATGSTSPATAVGAKRIEVNLTRQWLSAYQGSRLVLSSGVSTGRNGWWTPAGHFTILRKVPLRTMRGSAQGISWVVPNVPNVLYFREGGFALHGTYWHHDFGNGIRHSHGCINLPLGVAATLYHWAPIGTPLWVHY